MDVTTEILVKGGLSLCAVVALVWRHRRPGALQSEQAGAMLWTLAVLAVLAWPNFGRLHGASGIHHWEQFHYFLGSKYFPELGYDGIYAASLAAEREIGLGHGPQSHVRDLRNNVVVQTPGTVAFQRQVKERFSEARWHAFRDDVAYFLSSNRYEYITRVRLDHGYNPTPTWTFVARLFSSWAPAGDGSLALLAWLDPLLLAVMFTMLFRTFGSRVGCMALIVFGLGYPWRFDWVGGAFLRQDWLAAVGVAVCLIKRGRFSGAGLLVAYATMVRVFPGAFLVGPAVLAVRQLVQTRRAPRWALALFGAFLVGVVLCSGVGCITGRGAAAWTEFAGNLEKHSGTWLTNNVGMKNLLLYDVDTLTRKDVNFRLPEPWLLWQAKMNQREEQRKAVFLLVAGLLLAVIVVASLRLEIWQASVLGLAVVFVAVLLTCYYWAMLCLLPLGRGRWGPTAAWLGLNVGLFALHLMTPAFEMIYGCMSLMLLLFFIAWIGPDAWRSIRKLTGPRPTA